MSINNLNTYLNIKDSHLRVVSGNVYAQAMNIGGINVETAHGLQSVSDTGNVTSNTLQFSNATTGFVTTANAQIGRDLIVSGNATVSANATVADTLTISEHLIASKEATVTGNLHVTTIRSDSNVVAEYTGPHDRPLRKYPEVKFPLSTSSESPANGATTFTYKSYTVTGNSVYNDAASKISNAFDGEEHVTSWTGLSGDYDSNGDVASGKTANYLQIQLPNAIKLEKMKIISDGNYQYANGPRNITLYGSNNGSDWVTLKTETDLPLNGGTTNPDPQTAFVHVNTTTKYLYYKLEISKIWISSGGATYARIGEWELYGHEEGSGSLDTTLKTVYNVPATTGTQLEVYYDAKGESTVQSPIPDLSPNTNTGAVSGHSPTLDSTDGIDSFKFNGSSQYVTGAHGLTTGSDPVHTISLWFKRTVKVGQFEYLVQLGQGGTNFQQSAIFIQDDEIAYGHWGSGVGSYPIVDNIWYHVATTFTGGNASTLSNHKIYVNGVEIGINSRGSDGPFVLTGTALTLGRKEHAGGTPGDYFNGSIANFRLYSKVLNADQVKELYDYQKDYFFGTKSQVTLYKGHLGVGVTEPSGQLELAGDERIQEYPPRDLYQYDTNIEGHGVFCASASIEYTDGNHPAWEAFSDSATSASSESVWTTNGALYDTTSGLHTGSTTTAGIKGEWIQLKTPYKIKISSFNLNSYAVSVNSNRQPRDFILLGSNDGNVWEQMKSVAGQTKSGYTGVAPVYSGPLGPHHTVNSTKYYSYFRIVVTANQGGDALLGISRIRFFGTPGPTTLDKGSLTLGRSLDVPRVSRYDVDTETPRPEKLVVDFDTTVNSSPTDISGKGNHGVYYNGASYSPADKAFEFDNTQGGIRAQTTNFDTSGKHSFVAWMKFESFGQWYGLYGIGTNDGSASNFTIYTGTGGSGDVGNTGFRLESRGGGRHQDLAWTPVLNTWVHVAVTWDGTGGLNNVNMYIDLVKLERQQLGSYENNPTSSITLPSTQAIRVGADARQFNGAGTGSNFDGQISNPKLYDVALEPSEVRKLYNLGRTGRSMVISDTAVGIGKAPEAQLDVRGTLAVRGRVGVGTSSPNAELHVVGASGQLTSAQHYGFASGGPASNYGTGIHNTVSIYGNDDIVAGGYVLSHAGTMASSDERIKKEIVDVEDGEALSTLRLLKPKQYKYRDDVKRGTEPVWGFIAQEVSATLPYATQLRRETVPNIYELANVSDSNVITFTNFDTSTLESNVFNINVFDTENNEHTVNLTEIINERSIRVNTDLSNWTANVMTGNQIFVYGQQVDDFTFLKKDAIWTVATAALQEVDRQLQNEKIRNDTLETQVSDLTRELRAENNRLKNKVMILENRQTHFNTLLVNLIGRVETLERPA